MLQPSRARRLACGVGVLAAAALALTACADASASGAAGAITPSARPAVSSASPSPSVSPSVPAPVRGTVVTIGDSIMSGFGVDADEAWPELLERETGVPIVNLGCDGAGFVAEGDCGTDYSGMLADAIADEPVLVIVQSSDNDADEDPAAIRSATQEVVARLHAGLPHARIVGLSTLWNLPWEAPPTIEASSDALEAAVTSVGGVFVPLGQPFQDDPDLLQADSEHPTAEGQRVLASIVRVALDDHGVRL
ncbi:SGNH/GDSL hydrolase family protein [Microbacterium sp. NPDC091313]